MADFMKLSDWLEGDETADPPRPKMTHGEFAQRIGCAQPTVNRYVKGERIPEPEIMTKIVAETGGAVTPNDFYNVESSPPTAPDAPKTTASAA